MVLSNHELLRRQKRPDGVLIQGGRLLKPSIEAEDQDASGQGRSAASESQELIRITVQDLPKNLPDFEAAGATKDGLIAQWLKAWIVDSLAQGTLSEAHLLPKKAELAKYLGVSIGTVQNAIRFVEDEGHVESKQRIGTLIRDANGEGPLRMRKQTSKRDQAVVAVKQLIVSRSLKPGDPMPSAREVARLIGSAPNTTRLALEFLAGIGILQSQGVRGNKTNWYVEQIPDTSSDPTIQAIESETLIDQLERDLKALIADTHEVNDKLPSHLELAETFRVSIKTVHDAMKRLAEQGIVHSKRGRYGTYVSRKPDASKFFTPADADIFLPVEEATFYNYQRVEQHLKQLIGQQYQPGDKLPAMGNLAKDLDVSSNTIRKALQNLASEGVVTFSRGRYGGTFVSKMPEPTGTGAAPATFTWVSINPETIRSYRLTAEGKA